MATDRKAPELELILELAQEHSRIAEIERLAGRTDFETLLLALWRQKLVGMLGPRLLQAPISIEIPARFAQSVEDWISATKQEAELHQVVTWGLVHELERKGIPALALKGPFLSERLYRSPWMRPSTDIDLLVHPKELGRAVEVLTDAECRRVREIRGTPLLHHIFIHDSGVPVELHWRIGWYEARYAETMLVHARRQGGVLVPCPADELLSLLVFFARDGFQGLRFALDIAACHRRYAAGLNDFAARLSDHPELVPAAAAGAMVVEDLLDVPLRRLIPGHAFAIARTRLAASLADWAGEGAAGSVDVAKCAVDGLLCPPSGWPAFARRALFPKLPGDGIRRLRDQALFATARLYRLLMLYVRVTRAAPAARARREVPAVEPLSPASKARLASEIMLVYARVRWLMSRHPLPEVVERLRSRGPARTVGPLPDGTVNCLRLASAVVSTLEFLPVDSRCLMRSLVLLGVLARRAVEVELQIAAQPTGPQELEAHAWVELKGCPLLTPGEPGFGHLVTL